MGKKRPPPPVATGKGSLLHYFSSSPSVRTGSVSSSPARAGPSRANSLPHADATGSSTSRGKSGDQATPRAPLRATQSLGSLEVALRSSTAGDEAAVPRRGSIASTNSSSGVGALPQRLETAAGAHWRSPRLRLTPTVEESEEEPQGRAAVKAESPTPRRNPPRAASRNSLPALSPLRLAFAATPHRSRNGGSAVKGKGKAPEIYMSDSDLETHVKQEKCGSPGPLSLCTPSPAKRARRPKPKKIFAFTIDEQGRDVLDLTSSSPSVASVATLSSDSDSEVIVVSSRRPSRTPTAAPKQPISPTRRMEQERAALLSRPGAMSTSPRKTPRRTQAIAPVSHAVPSQNAVSSPDGRSPWTLRSNGDPAPSMAATGASQGSATPTGSRGCTHAQSAGDALSPFAPRSTTGTVVPTPADSVTLASISPPQLDAQQLVGSEPSMPSRPLPAATLPASLSALGIYQYQTAADGEETEHARSIQEPGRHSPTALSPTKSVPRLTQSAVRQLSVDAPATKAGGPESMFIRSPSGSPLSSLAPTPKRPTSPKPYRAQASPSRIAASTKPTKRLHSFELVIKVPRSASASKKPKLNHGGSNVLVPKPSTSGRSAAAKSLKQNRSEWDALMEEESDAGEADGEASEREASPSPAKARKTAPAARQQVSSEAESMESGDDSDSDDEEELATFLERARARREAGAALTSTTGTSPSAATVPTTVSPPTPETSTRRSKRALHENEPHLPGRFAKSAASPRQSRAGSKKAPSLFTGQQHETRDGRDAFNRMMRERKKQEEKGHTTAWYDKWKRALQRDGDEDGISDDGEEQTPEAAGQEPAAWAQVQAEEDAAGLEAAFAAGSDDELEPPKAIQAAAKTKAKVVGKLLDEERAREAARQRDEADASKELRDRTVWRSGPIYVRSLESVAAEMQGEEWLSRTASLLQASIRDPAAMPSPILLFSPFSGADRGSVADRRVLASWLFRLICHPSMSSSLAPKLQAMLSRLLAYGDGWPRLAFDDLAELLEEVGLQTESDNAEGREDATAVDPSDPIPDEEGRMKIDPAARHSVVLRWCGLAQTLLSAPEASPAPDSQDMVKLAKLLVRLTLDPTSSLLRSSVRRLLRSALAILHKSPTAAGQLFTQLARKYRHAQPRVQFAVLQTLPHDNEQDKQLRRWLACALLAPVEQYEDLAAQRDLSQPVLPQIRKVLGSHAADGVFVPQANAAPDVLVDSMLVVRARMLMLALASLSYELYDHDDRSARLRHDLDAIVAHVRKIDGRFRADARKGLAVERLLAKNLFTALVHSLTYQLRAARGQKAGSDLTEEAARALVAQERATKALDVAQQDPKQLKLAFGCAPKTDPAPGSLRVRAEPAAAGDEDEDMISDISDDEGLLRA
ncbi:hypothetical protein JCM3774_006072 [Rhodotorula dairenensis]